MKRVVSIMRGILLVCALACLTGCTDTDGENGTTIDGSSTEAGVRTKDLKNLTADNLFYVSIMSNNSDDSNQNVRIQISLDEGVIERDFWDGDNTKSTEVILKEEQCQELREQIVEYSHTVQEKEKDYWPQTDEYPAMMVLFEYEIWFGDDEYYEKYRQNGALCYPDGWDAFVEKLLAY